MISNTDIAGFVNRAIAVNQSWKRKRSSLRFTLNAIDAYNHAPALAGVHHIRAVRNAIPAIKETKYANALAFLDNVLNTEDEYASTQELLQRLQENKFRVTSDAGGYESTFGDSFRKQRNGLTKGQRWLDGGSGEARAMIEYLEDEGPARCTATGYAVPTAAEGRVAEAIKGYKGRFEYISGKYFGDISNQELDWPRGGDFDLITDLNGVLYYTQDFVGDLERYLELLSVGGVLFFSDVAADIEFTAEDFDLRRAKAPALAKWMANIAGIRVTYHYSSGGSYEITKIKDTIIVPEMRQKQYLTRIDNNNPQRSFVCTLELPNDALSVT